MSFCSNCNSYNQETGKCKVSGNHTEPGWFCSKYTRYVERRRSDYESDVIQS